MSHLCEVCRLTVNSEKILQEHCRGKKHKRNQALYDKRRDLTERSVFTRGFPPSTDEATLRQYFSQFGQIQRIILDKHRGMYAIVEFAPGDAVEKIFAQTNHTISGHEVVIKPRDFKPPPPPKPPEGQSFARSRRRAQQPEQSAACKAREAQELLERFNFHVDAFPTADAVDGVLRACGSLRGDGLPESYSFTKKPASHDVKLNDVAGQVRKLADLVKLEADDMKARSTIVSSLQQLFQQFFPGCELHVYGSTVNGFGMKGCDMDLYLDLGCEARAEEERRTGNVQYPDHTPPLTLCDCPKCVDGFTPKHKRLRLGGIVSLEGGQFPVSAASLAEVPLYDKAKLVCRILCQFEPSCDDAMTIPSLRCPVVRFSHSPTTIKCDLSINNRLALQNTRLLRLFCDLDPRVRLLVASVRYWGRLREVAGNQDCGPRLTNYALSLLVIFFLQNCQPPVVPTLHSLHGNVAEKERILIDDWDCSFSSADPKENSANTASVDELLVEFFRFYSSIDFNNVVICTRTGEAVAMSEFFCGLVTSDRAKQFKRGPLSVQDPFVLDHNIALNVNEKVRLRLVSELKRAADICWGFGKCHGGETETWGLLRLVAGPSSSDTPPGPHASEHSQSGADPWSFFLLLKMSQLSESLVKHLHAGADYRVRWVSLVCHFIVTVLTDLLLFQCDVLSEGFDDLETVLGSQLRNRGMSVSTGEVTQPHTAAGANCFATRTAKRFTAESRMEDTDHVKRCKLDPSESHSETKTGDGGVTDGAPQDTVNTSTASDSQTEPPPSVASNTQTERQPMVVTSTMAESQRGNLDVQIITKHGAVTETPVAPPQPCLQLRCRSFHRAWSGRKAVRRTLLENPGVKDTLALEKQVGEIVGRAEPPSEQPVLQFNLLVRADIEAGRTAATVSLQPSKATAKEFTCFYPFFKTYLIKGADKYLTEITSDDSS